MLTIRQKKNVIDNKVVLEIPDHFGKEVEVIILSKADEEEKLGSGNEKMAEKNSADKSWSNLTVKEFLAGYGDKDSIYDNINSGCWSLGSGSLVPVTN